jgi:hypothetical protein
MKPISKRGMFLCKIGSLLYLLSIRAGISVEIDRTGRPILVLGRA